MQNNPSESTGTKPSAPTGGHALEVAARHGFGPLSPEVKEVWHGYGTPCVTCGQIVRRDATACGHCGQNLRPEMLEKMKALSGPWYVLEHLRPFPGINLERIVKQIHRGLITETSIVRGPATHHQWRFALETPGLCRYFGKCWHCFCPIGQAETHCQQCGEHLTFEPTRPLTANNPAVKPTTPRSGIPNGSTVPGPGSATPTALHVATPFSAARARFEEEATGNAPVTGTTASELDRLRAALSQGVITTPDSRIDPPATIAGIRAGWFAGGVVLMILLALWIIAGSRTGASPETPQKMITVPTDVVPPTHAPTTEPITP